MESAWCRWTISNRRQFVDETHPIEVTDPKTGKKVKMTWWQLRPLTIKLPYQTWAAIKKFIIEICKDTEQCTEEVASWDRAVSDIDSWLEKNRSFSESTGRLP